MCLCREGASISCNLVRLLGHCTTEISAELSPMRFVAICAVFGYLVVGFASLDV
jgi:hypothetical protein